MLSSRLLFFSALLCAIPLHASAQSAVSSPEAALSKVRSRYYTPVDAGLESFHCEVRFDWKDFMQKATNQQIPDDDERLKYLRTIGLSVDDSLHGTGSLSWHAPTPPPDHSEASIAKIKGGMQQIWSGFFQSWNSFVSGDLTSIDPKATVERNPQGFHVTAREEDGSAEEQYDGDLLLKTVRVSTSTLESTIHPTFTASPQGLLVTDILSSYKQPPSAPTPTEVDMRIRYAPVGSFQLPSELQIAVGPAQFAFQLFNCTVSTHISKP